MMIDSEVGRRLTGGLDIGGQGWEYGSVLGGGSVG